MLEAIMCAIPGFFSTIVIFGKCQFPKYGIKFRSGERRFTILGRENIWYGYYLDQTGQDSNIINDCPTESSEGKCVDLWEE